MALIAPQTVYTKTAKGILEIRNKSVKLSKELSTVFLSVDGRITVEELLPRLGLTNAQLQQALNTLVTEGYIKTVSSPVQHGGGAAAAPDASELDFASSRQEVSRLNLEAASRALAETEANKAAQQEARAALEARLRQEAEARARALAEVRAQAEAEARAKAEAAARSAADAQAQAEIEARSANDPAVRAQAEGRARNAAATAVRAQAEARTRAEAEERARALAEEKKIAEQQARVEAEARARSEEQAHARAAAEGRARAALEAQIAAIQAVQAHAGKPEAQEAETARAQLHEREAAAERARDEAQALEQAAGLAKEEPLGDLHFDDLAQKLTARVHAERRAREEAERKSRATQAETQAAAQSAVDRAHAFPALELAPADRPTESVPAAPAQAQAQAADNAELPALSFSTMTGPGDVPHVTPEHVPSALERAMLETAARAQQLENEPPPPRPTPASARVVPPQPEPSVRTLATPPAEPAAEADAAPAAKVEPTLDDEPASARVNVDRAAHDVLADAADARRKSELSALTRKSEATRRQRMEEDARRDASAVRRQTRRRLGRTVVIALVALPLMGVAYLQFVPLNGYVPEAQQALSERLNQPVTISTLRYVLLPTPRVVLEGVNVGVEPGIRVARVEAHAWPFAFVGGAPEFGRVGVKGVNIDPGMLGAIPSWTGGRSAAAIHAKRLELSDVKLSLADGDLPPMSGDVTFEPNGTVAQATLTSEKLSVKIAPQQSGVRLVVNGRDVQLPFGPPVTFSHLTIDGLADRQRFSTTELNGRLGGGSIKGTLAARWEGPVIVGGEFQLQGARLDELLPQLVPEFGAKGSLTANARYAAQTDPATGRLGRPLVEGAFAVTRGELINIDLVRAIQSPGGNTFRGGRTGFNELRGTVQARDGAYNYRQLQLTSGPINATGQLDVAPNGQLSGRLNGEIAPHGSVTIRATLNVSGTIKDPRLTR